MSDSVTKYHENMSDREIMNSKISFKRDKHVQQVKAKFEERSQIGINKYNSTLEREDLNILDWLNHAQEEAMDLTLYLEKIKSLITEKGLDKLI